MWAWVCLLTCVPRLQEVVIPSSSLQYIAALEELQRPNWWPDVSPCAGCWEKVDMEFKHVSNGLMQLGWGYDLLTHLLDSKFL